MKRYAFPSLMSVLLLFVLVGPFLWGVAFLALGLEPSEFLKSPTLAKLGGAGLVGAIGWWTVGLFVPKFWIGTWVPTVAAAVAYWFAMHLLSRRLPLAFAPKVSWLALNILVCATLSTGLFLAAFIAGSVVEAGAVRLPLSTWVAAVALTGAALGLLVGASATKAPNPSIERTCPGKPRHLAHVERWIP